MRDGKAIVNCKRFMGYDKDENGQLVINREQAKVVERIFREYLDGKGVAAICKGLERDKIPTVSGKYKWYDSVVRKMLRNEKYYGELLLQKTVTLDYLTKYRVPNRNHAEQYRIENDHEPIISKELWDMAQKERERRNEIYAGVNKDRSKYTKRYAFSGKLICGICGTTFKRRHWNSKASCRKIVWQCLNYIEKDAVTGQRCPAKAVADDILKDAFVQVYNEAFKSKADFYDSFLENVEKVISSDTSETDRISERIAALEADISGLITMKLHQQIDDDAYNREYQKMNRELTDLKIQKDGLDKSRLRQSRRGRKMAAVRSIIGDGSQPLNAFDEALFDAMVAKVIIQSPVCFEFHFENGRVISYVDGRIIDENL